MKKIALLGSTGSIGKSTVRVACSLPEEVEVTALAAYSNHELLREQIARFKPKIACIYEECHREQLQSHFPDVHIVSGASGLKEVVSHPDVDLVVMAIAGSAALTPTIEAIKAKKTIALASKEVMVAAGEYITSLAREYGVSFLPIDSEHSAIFQCMQGSRHSHVRRLILTASGGPFRLHSKERLREVTLEEALAHPTWNMGPKVTVDCSTLVNKGLELIEARWLFDIPVEKIDVVIHPQSLVHSFVEMVDGSLLAQISETDMCLPIQYALCYPERKPGLFPPFDFTKHSTMSFFAPDYERFPGLKMAYDALRAQKSYCTYFNAANEVLVERFLKKDISWCSIGHLLEKLMDSHSPVPIESLEDIHFVEAQARKEAKSA